jgi:hypothetical protein
MLQLVNFKKIIFKEEGAHSYCMILPYRYVHANIIVHGLHIYILHAHVHAKIQK